MGDKVAAKKAADLAGVPTLPATPNPVSKPAEALKWGKKIGFPLIIKAAFGGGGRGMRVVNKEEDLKPMLEEAQGEAEGHLVIQPFSSSVRWKSQTSRGSGIGRPAWQCCASARKGLFCTKTLPKSGGGSSFYRSAPASD